MSARSRLASEVDIPIEECLESDQMDRSQTRVKVRRETTARWPVLLCGFLAGLAGGVALMQSPLGASPVVQEVVKSARAHGVMAWTATMQFLDDLGT